MMRVGPLLLFILLSSPFLWAKNLTVVVRDPDLNLPLQGATVKADSIVGKTDAAGKVTLIIPDGKEVTLLVTYPGYTASRTTVQPQKTHVTVSLRLAGVVTGPKVVVERPKPDQNDAVPGVSHVVSQPAIKDTAEIGLFEDLMTSIQLLPGVAYGGSFDPEPSVRGGDPSETVAYLDGAPILFPYHWGGLVSIFDPTFVDSAKFSDGIISARYGDVLSGLLEVTSKSPLSKKPALSFGISTTSLDGYLQLPLSGSFGIMAGGHITWMEVPFAAFGASSYFNRVPYIQDGYARMEWKPAENVDWSTNFFYGTDGFSQKSNSIINIGLSTYPQEDYRTTNWAATSAVKWLLNGQQLLSLVASANDYHSSISFPETTGAGESTDAQQYFASAEWNVKAGRNNLFALGASARFLSDQNQISTDTAYPGYSFAPPRNYANGWAGYALDRFSFLSRHVEGELGVRFEGEHIFGDGFDVNTSPVLNPRLRLQLNPFADGALRGLELHIGTGLYSQVPLQAFYFSTNPENGTLVNALKPERSWMTDLGTSLSWGNGWQVSVDGYYKNYWDRLYEFTSLKKTANYSQYPLELYLYNDGIGYATGVEVMVKRLRGKFWDGWIDYTFNFTRYYDPSTADQNPAFTSSVFPTSAPVGMWYYPIYQRMHTVNIVFNWTPTSWLTVTTTGTFATGTPPFQHNATAFYSDSARTPNVYDLNLKVSFHGAYGKSAVRWELYIAVQNLLVNLLSSATVVNESGTEVIFDLGYPVPSFGYKMSY